MMHAYSVQTQIGHGETAKPFRFIFETPLPGVDAIVAMLGRDGVVMGLKLKTVDDGKGGRTITDRSPIAFGVTGLVTIQPFDRTLGEVQP